MQTVIDRGGAVYAVGSSPEAANYEAWGMQFDPLVEGYFENPSPKNIVQLIQFLSDRHLGSAFKPDPPQHFPEYALIDWRTGELYEDIDSFQQAYDPVEAPWIGLYGFRYAFVTGQDGYLRSYAKALSEAGFNVMLFYGFPLEQAIDQFCLDPAGKSRIEVLINCSSLPGGSPEKLAQSFARLDVPVINGISVSQSKTIWEKSRERYFRGRAHIGTGPARGIMDKYSPPCWPTQEAESTVWAIALHKKSLSPRESLRHGSALKHGSVYERNSRNRKK